MDQDLKWYPELPELTYEQIEKLKRKKTKYTSRQLNRLWDSGVDIHVPKQPRLRSKYLDNHVHDYTDPEARSFDSNPNYECFRQCCCWCSKIKHSRNS